MSIGRKLRLALAAIVTLALGYILGNLYSHRPPDNLTAHLLEEAVEIEVKELYSQNKTTFPALYEKDWVVVLTGLNDRQACRPLLGHYLGVWNRLAITPVLQNKLKLAYYTLDQPGEVSKETQDWVGFYQPYATVFSADKEAASILAMQIQLPYGSKAAGICDIAKHKAALVGPGLKLHAFLNGMTDTATIAKDITDIVRHIDPHYLSK